LRINADPNAYSNTNSVACRNSRPNAHTDTYANFDAYSDTDYANTDTNSNSDAGDCD